MPNQSDPNQTQPTTGTPPAQTDPQSAFTPPVSDTPPIIPDFQATDIPSMPTETQPIDTPPPPPESPAETPSDTGTSAPPEIPPVISSTPKKKFGTGKIIATILGFLVLTGGIIGGVVLTQQQQDIREKAVCKNPNNPACSNYDGGSSGGSSGGSVVNTAYNDCIAAGNSAGECNAATGNNTGYTEVVNNSGSGGSSSTSGGGYTYEDCIADGNTPSECGAATGSIGDYTGSGSTSGSSGSGSTAYEDCIANGNTPSECRAATTSVTQECIGRCVQGGQTPDTCTLICERQLTTTDPGTYLLEPETGYGDCNSQFPKFGARSQDGAEQACISHCDTGASSAEIGTADCDALGVGIVGAIRGGAFCYACEGEGAGVFTSTGGGGGGSGTTTTSGSEPGGQCQDIKAYKTDWTLLSATDLAGLKAGNQVNFCVRGSTTDGAFDKARFTINDTVQAETTTIRPGSTNEFCQLYTIPEAITSFTITAQIHHATLDWK